MNFAVSNLSMMLWSNGMRYGFTRMSQRLRVGRTTILWVLKGFGLKFNIVALQLQKLVQKLDQEVALTWLLGLS